METEPCGRALALLLAVACSCRPLAASPAIQPENAASAGATSRQVTPRVGLRTAPSTHAWQLRPDSPFHLVGEKLRDVRIEDLGGTPVVIHGTCNTPQDAEASELGSRSFSLRAASGDDFVPAPLPDSPASEAEIDSLEVWGQYPENIWLGYGLLHHPPMPERRLLQWSGSDWREPHATRYNQTLDRSFAWFGGAALITQTQAWPHSGLGTLFIFGPSSHPAPTFTELPLPQDERRDFPPVHVEFATLPSHEVFLLHTTEFYSKHRVVASLARSTGPGRGSVRELEAAPLVSAHLSSGRVSGRDVVVAFGDAITGDSYAPFVYIADATSVSKLPALDPPRSRDELSVWLAGDRVWARRGKWVWQSDGGEWRKFVEFPANGALSAAARGSSLWGELNDQLVRFDANGQPHEVPFLDEASRSMLGRLWVRVLGEDDVWVIALSEQDEAFVFRNRPMRSILACDLTPPDAE